MQCKSTTRLVELRVLNSHEPGGSLLPIMVTRLMLSLKRVANSPGSMWSFHNTVQPDTIRFAGHTMSGTEFSDDSYDLKNLPSKNKSSPTPAEP